MNTVATARNWDVSIAHQPIRRSLCLSTALLLVVILIGVMSGPSGTSVGLVDTVKVIAGHVPLLNSVLHVDLTTTPDAMIWQSRLPRIAAAVLIGTLLGLAGVALQGLLLNPLADPYTVGVSAGAAVGSALAEVAGFSMFLLGFAGAASAFVGAVLAVAAVYTLARVSGRVSSQTFLLAGVVVGSCLWSLIPLLLVLAGRGNELTRVLFYLVGSLQNIDWARSLMLAPFVILAWILLRAWARELNLMSLGEDTAAHLGVDTEKFKRRVVLVASLATAAAVSVGGVIGFVGLIVPHVARRIAGPDHRAIVPLSGLYGAVLLVAADTLVRAPLADQMPVGVVTSIVGAPVFCYLLRKRALA